MFHYPTGAARWAEFHGLITSDQHANIRTLAADSQGAVRRNLLLKQQNKSITTPMFCLPPVPLAKFGGNPGLYWVTLVDERYMWQWSSRTSFSGLGQEWLSIINHCMTNLGVTYTNDPILAVYGKPNTNTDLYSQVENTALLLDCACWNVGLTAVRNYNGTYRLINNASSNTTIAQNLAAVGGADKMAGGDQFGGFVFNADNLVWLNSVFPKNVTVNFPIYNYTGVGTTCNAPGYANPWSDHLRSPVTAGDQWVVNVPLTSLPQYNVIKGHDGTKVFHSSAPAYINAPNTDPVNQAELNTLAVQLATAHK